MAIPLSGLLLASNPIAAKIAGGILAIAAVGIHRKNDLYDEDYVAGMRGLWREGSQGVRFLWSEVAPTKADARRLYVRLKEPQPQFKTRVQALAERLLQDDEWFPDFTRRSKLVVGNTGDGKTRLQLFDVANFLQSHPEGHLTIIDLDYGSSHEGSAPNYWFNLPRDRYIRVTYEEARDAILDEYEIMLGRIERAREQQSTPEDRQWRFLGIDEAIAVIREAKVRASRVRGSSELTDLLNAVSELLYRGLKQRIKVSFGLQVLAVGETNLSLALQKQNNVILLGSAALDRDNLSRIGCDDPDEVIEQVKQMRSLPGCQYAAVVRRKGEISVQVVPYINVSDIEIDLPDDDEPDEVEVWWKSVYTDEIKEWLRDLADDYLSGNIKSPLKGTICPRFGIPKPLRSDPKYVRVSEAWEEAKARVQAVTEEKTA